MNLICPLNICPLNSIKAPSNMDLLQLFLWETHIAVQTMKQCDFGMGEACVTQIFAMRYLYFAFMCIISPLASPNRVCTNLAGISCNSSYSPGISWLHGTRTWKYFFPFCHAIWGICNLMSIGRLFFIDDTGCLYNKSHLRQSDLCFCRCHFNRRWVIFCDFVF